MDVNSVGLEFFPKPALITFYDKRNAFNILYNIYINILVLKDTINEKSQRRGINTCKLTRYMRYIRPTNSMC